MTTRCENMFFCLIWYSLFGIIYFCCTSCCHSICGASGPGDVVIGVLSPCHSKVENLDMRIKPERFNCTEFYLSAFVQTLAVLHTINIINNSSILPGIHLGYVICDTCSDAGKAIENIVHLLSINNTLPIQGGLIQQPTVKAIIGERFSEVSIAVARVLGLYMVPQISTTSSAETLDDKLRYPAFLRTIPSDRHQTRALSQLMKTFNWTWVGVVSGDDDYGRNALQSFLKDAEEVEICPAFNEVIPQNMANSNIGQRINELADVIQSSTAQVVLIILKEKLVEQLFKVLLERGISRTWIASDSWSMHRPLATSKGINKLGDIFGFSFMTGEIPGFKGFLTNLLPGPGAVNKFIEEYKYLRFGCSEEVKQHQDCLKSKPVDQCPLPESLKWKSELACQLPDPQTANDDFLTHEIDLRRVYSDYVATWSIAFALRALLKCNDSICLEERDFSPWKLLQELKKINFTLGKKQFSFDKFGNFETGYDLVNWVRSGDERHIEVIGRYDMKKRVVEFIAESIDWGTPNKTIPESKCSGSCRPGTFKVISSISCCYNCSECEAGTYSNVTDVQSCFICPNGTWSLKGWTKCVQRKEVYFGWDDPFAITVLTFTVLGFVLLLSVLIVFVKSRKSVVFQVAGGNLCFVIIAGLIVSFGAVVMFVGRPNGYICKARQTMYGLGLTLSVSCILVKAFRAFLAYLECLSNHADNPNDVHRNQHHRLKKLHNPPAIIVCGTAIQGLICLLWLLFDAPTLEENTEKLEIELLCSEGSNWGFGAMLGYIALLALICFILAFKARKNPQRFNETGYIIFSMVIYLFVWICFIPVYVEKIQQRSEIQAAAIVVSNFGIIACHFLPKCYMILCKKKKDISRQAYALRPRHNSESRDHISLDSVQYTRTRPCANCKRRIIASSKMHLSHYF